MMDKAQISFESSGDDVPPFVTIHNSAVLSAALTQQIARYGVSKRAGVEGLLSGRLQGARTDFLAMVQSYGIGIEIIRKR